jgi:hypothetical protein
MNMGLFNSNKRRQGSSDGRPGTVPFGSGRRLRSDLSPRDCVEAPPPIENSIVDETLQAAGYPLTPENRAKIAELFTAMFLVKCQELVTSLQGAQAAERFVAAHAQHADWTSAVGPLRTALQQLAEWEPSVLSYTQNPLDPPPEAWPAMSEYGRNWLDDKRNSSCRNRPDSTASQPSADVRWQFCRGAKRARGISGNVVRHPLAIAGAPLVCSG